MRPLITIVARGGSKGLPGKNTKILHGKPLVAWSIEQALKWVKAGVAVSSDDDAILTVAKQYPECAIIKRPTDLACDDTPKVDAIRHALMWVEAGSHEPGGFDPIIDLDVTNPMRRISDIEAIYQLWLACRPDTIFSVTKARRSPYFNMVEGQNGFARISKPFSSSVTRRQDCPDCWDLNCCLYVYSREWLLDPARDEYKSCITGNSLFYEMPEETFCDSDTPVSWKVMEMLFEKYGYSGPKLKLSYPYLPGQIALEERS